MLQAFVLSGEIGCFDQDPVCRPLAGQLKSVTVNGLQWILLCGIFGAER